MSLIKNKFIYLQNMFKFIKSLLKKVKIIRYIIILLSLSCLPKKEEKTTQVIYLSHSFLTSAHGTCQNLGIGLIYVDKIKCKESFSINFPENFDVIKYNNNIEVGFYRSTCDTFYDFPISEGFVYLKNYKDKLKVKVAVKNIKFDGFVNKNTSIRSPISTKCSK